MYGREEIGGERRAKGANHVVPCHPLAVAGAWPTREQRVLQAVGLTASPTAAHVAHGLGCPLACSPGSLARILGVRTPISNPFPDYEP